LLLLVVVVVPVINQLPNPSSIKGQITEKSAAKAVTLSYMK